MKIRTATKDDLHIIFHFVEELASFEKAPHEVITTLEYYQRQWADKLFDAIIAEDQDQMIGMALFYYGFSTWKGKFLYLEDLIIEKSFRGKGYGKLVFDHLMDLAKFNKCSHMRWQVLDWNEEAIKFYESFGSEITGGWKNGKLFLNT